MCTHVSSTQYPQTANYAGPVYIYREAMGMSTSYNRKKYGQVHYISHNMDKSYGQVHYT